MSIIMRVPCSWPYHFLKTLPPNTITVWIRLQNMNFNFLKSIKYFQSIAKTEICQMENILKVINSWWDIAKGKIIVLEYTARNNPKGKPEKNIAKKKMLTEYQWVNQNMQASSLINMLCEGGQKKTHKDSSKNFKIWNQSSSKNKKKMTLRDIII